MKPDWPKVRLGEVLRHRKEFVTIDDLTTYRRPRVQLHAQGIILRDEVPGSLIKTKQQQVCRAGDLLVAEIDAKVGGFGIVPRALGGSIVSGHYFLFEIEEAKLDRRFLDYFARTPSFHEQIAAKGSTNYAAIRPADVLSYEIPLPPLTEQWRVVATIEELAARIHEARSIRQQAMGVSEGLLRSALSQLTQNAKPTGVLGSVLVAPPRNGWSAKCDNADGGTAVLSLGAITGFRYRRTEFKRTSLPASQQGHFWLEPGDLLITRSNTAELVGHAAIYDGEPRPCIYPDLMMRLETESHAVERRFVWYWLRSQPVREFLSTHAKGTSPTMKKISRVTVMAIPFPSTIPVVEQRRIVAKLDALQTEIDVLKRLQGETAADLDALLRSVVDHALDGRL